MIDSANAPLMIEPSSSERERLRLAAQSAGVDVSEFVLQAALARAASELTQDYVTRISPEGMAKLREFQTGVNSQRPARPRRPEQAYEDEANRPVAGLLPNPQPALNFDATLAPERLSHEGHSR